MPNLEYSPLLKIRDTHKQKIIEDILEKFNAFETSFSGFYGEYDDISKQYNIRHVKKSGQPKFAFSSQVSEITRGVRTMSSSIFRMLFGNDPYIYPVARGLDPFGQPLSEEALFGAQAVLIRQHREFFFKNEMMRILYSLTGIGTVVGVLGWDSRPYGANFASIESTHFRLKPLLQCFFDPAAYDIRYSDYFGYIDYQTTAQIRRSVASDPAGWDVACVEKALGMSEEVTGGKTDIYSKINQRKQRSGYNQTDGRLNELITYHGVPGDTKNPILETMWNELGMDGDWRISDWTFVILNGTYLVRAFPTPFGNWRHVAKTASIHQWEMEPIGYGIGRTGMKSQQEMNFLDSRNKDQITAAILNMWLVKKFGVKLEDIGFRPNGTIEVEDIERSMAPLRPAIEAAAAGIGLVDKMKEDFRTTNLVPSNMQGELSNVSATANQIAHGEGIRGISNITELVADPLLRDTVNSQHLYNLALLDAPIWESIGGQGAPPMPWSRNTLPMNIGFETRIVTDRNYRPERQNGILQAIQMLSSMRSVVPDSQNPLPALLEELFRTFDLDPRRLKQPLTPQESLMRKLRAAKDMGGPGMGAMQAELNGEIASVGAEGNVNTPDSPKGARGLEPVMTI